MVEQQQHCHVTYGVWVTCGLVYCILCPPRAGVERQVILTPNNTLVTAHSGTNALLPCTVDMEYRFGVVSAIKLL